MVASRHHGFTLIETMIAISVGVAIIGIALVFALPARNASRAAQIAGAIREIRVETERAFLVEGGYAQASVADLRKRTHSLEHLYDAGTGLFAAAGVALELEGASYRNGGPGAWGDSYRIGVHPVPASVCTNLAGEFAPEAIRMTVHPVSLGYDIEIPVGSSTDITAIAAACSKAASARLDLYFH